MRRWLRGRPPPAPHRSSAGAASGTRSVRSSPCRRSGCAIACVRLSALRRLSLSRGRWRCHSPSGSFWGGSLSRAGTSPRAAPFAFWAVLGTLSALRGNVSAAGRSAVLALGGTAVGVLIAVPFVGITGAFPWLWWLVLPLLVFLAAYTPAGINFVVGQASFSILVVVLFNILAPTDWQIGLVRLEDAALGVGISAVVGLLLWPRGAQGQLRSALADLYAAAASSLSFSFRRMLTDADEHVQEVSASNRIARTEAIRTQEVFEQFLKERTRQAPGVEVWAMLLSSGKGFLLIGDVLDWLF